eukprot:4192200-Lingulodinium_polyedra.AAC.1
MKELEKKYTPEEIQDLLESGGLQEVRHSSQGRIAMYIDHSNWTKINMFIHKRGMNMNWDDSMDASQRNEYQD